MNKMVDGQQRPLDCLRVDFTCEIPKSICLDIQIYRVRPFVQGPTRCFKCQNFGHISSKCKSFAKCTKCSGPHSVDQCTSSTLKCANCQGNHSNNFKKCPRFLVAKDIEWVSRTDKISFAQAAKKIKEAMNTASSVSIPSQSNNDIFPKLVDPAPALKQVRHNFPPRITLVGQRCLPQRPQLKLW